MHVDDKVAAIPAPSGVPVGCIMIWMNSQPPAGWLKLQGGSFDVNEYPELHAYLQGTSGYTSGKLPNWAGYYPGEYGDHLTDSLGSKQGAKTGQPWRRSQKLVLYSQWKQTHVQRSGRH